MQSAHVDERHTFIIRLWQESDEGDTLWRGHISHAASKDGKHIDQLTEIQHFIAPYLRVPRKEEQLLPPFISRLLYWLQSRLLQR